MLRSFGLWCVCWACLGLLGLVGFVLVALFSDGRVLDLAGLVVLLSCLLVLLSCLLVLLFPAIFGLRVLGILGQASSQPAQLQLR